MRPIPEEDMSYACVRGVAKRAHSGAQLLRPFGIRPAPRVCSTRKVHACACCTPFRTASPGGVAGLRNTGSAPPSGGTVAGARSRSHARAHTPIHTQGCGNNHQCSTYCLVSGNPTLDDVESVSWNPQFPSQAHQSFFIFRTGESLVLGAKHAETKSGI